MSTASARKLCTNSLLLVALTSIVACGGCGGQKANNTTSYLESVNPASIERHGQLLFVNDVRVGCQLARQNEMPCLFFFTADWCTFCHRMSDTAFTDATVGELGKSFVCVLVDADRDKELCQYFSITGFPTVELVSSQGQSLYRLVGQQSPAALAAGMRTALGRYAWVTDSQVR